MVTGGPEPRAGAGGMRPGRVGSPYLKKNTRTLIKAFYTYTRAIILAYKLVHTLARRLRRASYEYEYNYDYDSSGHNIYYFCTCKILLRNWIYRNRIRTMHPGYGLYTVVHYIYLRPRHSYPAYLLLVLLVVPDCTTTGNVGTPW